MSREIWFLRHAEAVPHGSAPDAERPLTKKGENQSRAAGEALAQLGIEFAHVFTSPKVRALETAQIACEALGTKPVVYEPLAGSFDAGEALSLLAGPGQDGPILVVGHEPDFSLTVHALTGGRIDLKKGGVAGVRVDGGSGDLRALMRPRELELIAP